MPKPDLDGPPAYIHLPGSVRLHYVESGNGDTPVVLLHGYSMSSVVWEKTMPLFPAETRALAIDLRGFGRSDKPESGYTCAELADDTVEFLNSLSIPKAVLIGHSFGGQVAQSFAAKYPERLIALVLCDTVAATLPPEGLSRFVAARISGYGSPDMNRRVFRASIPRYFDSRNVTPEDIERFIEIGLQAGNTALRECLKANYATPAIPVQQFAAVQAPALIVVATHDPFGAFDHAIAMSDALPNSRIAVIPRCGHTPMWERPSEFAAAITEFLKSSGLIKKG